jgi:hypothetical protein
MLAMLIHKECQISLFRLRRITWAHIFRLGTTSPSDFRNYWAGTSPVPAGVARVSRYSMASDGVQKISSKSCAFIQ